MMKKALLITTVLCSISAVASEKIETKFAYVKNKEGKSNCKMKTVLQGGDKILEELTWTDNSKANQRSFISKGKIHMVELDHDHDGFYEIFQIWGEKFSSYERSKSGKITPLDAKSYKELVEKITKK